MKTLATDSCASHRPVLDAVFLAAEIERLLQTLQVIRNLADAPHWEADRRWRIRDLAEQEIKRVRADHRAKNETP